MSHCILVVEDNRETAAKIASMVRSMGFRVLVAHDVKTALELLRTNDVCLILADHELPFEPGMEPETASGEHLLKEARAFDHRPVVGGIGWALDIIVVTAVSIESAFVSRMHRLGATYFHPKPLGPDSMRELVRKIGECFEQTKRVRHEDCAPYARFVEGRVTPHLSIDGTRVRARMVVTIDEQRREMQESPFVSLLLAVGVHVRSPKTWSSQEALRIPPIGAAINRIRKPFEGLVPGHFHALEVRRGVGCRLNPAIVVGPVAWRVLDGHPNPHVAKLAKEMLARERTR